MKSLEIKGLGLEEMSLEEKVSVDGGIPVIVAIVLIAGALLILSGDTQEDPTVDGGELDPAVCYG